MIYIYSSIQPLLILTGVFLYAVGVLSGLKVMSVFNNLNKLEAVAFVGSITSCFCFCILLVLWLVTVNDSTMEQDFAFAFDMTHISSAVAAIAFHIMIKRAHGG